MNIINSNLSEKDKNTLISDFLKKLGQRLRTRRTKLNIAQEDLAKYLGIDRSTISKYETGNRDISVSTLALYGVYCKFPLDELFPKDESKTILEAFSKAVTITAKRNKKQTEKYSFYMGKMASFEFDKPLSERYREASIPTVETPCTVSDFALYIETMEQETIDSISAASKLLNQIDKSPRNESLKENLADYITNAIIIEDISSNPYTTDRTTDRVYAYYKYLYDKILNDMDD